MKKLFAIAGLLLLALVNGISPAIGDDKTFTPEDYYTGNFHDETDYQQLYLDYIGSNSGESDSCNLTHVSVSSLQGRITSNSGKYWFIYEQTGSLDKLVSDKKKETSLKTKMGNTIIAPTQCTIITSAGSSNAGTRMSVQVGDYKVTFYNMNRWYCCRDRKPSISEDNTATFTHNKDAKGEVMKAGSILGYASASTTVLIEKTVNGVTETVSLEEFYSK